MSVKGKSHSASLYQISIFHNQSHVTTHTLFSTALWLMSRHLNAATWFQKPWSIGAACIDRIEIVKLKAFCSKMKEKKANAQNMV